MNPEIPQTPPGFRSGYVALIGRPNVGKSTLLNAILGEKVAIVSNKPQTTRHRILGIHTEEDCQIVFLDTPGMHKPKEALNRFMVDQAMSSLVDGDLTVAIVAGDQSIGKGDRFLIERIRESGVPYMAVLNKIDLLEPNRLAATWEQFEALTEGAFERVAISALQGSGVEEILRNLKARLPEGPMFYPEDALTDRSQRFQMAELVREQVIRATQEELPYASAVRIEQFEEKDGDPPLVVIEATVSVERDSQKGMIIGKHGEMLKKIGTLARKEMEKSLGKKVYLELRADVRKNWRKNPKELRKLGYSDEVA